MQASKLNTSLFSPNRILKRILAPSAAIISFKPHPLINNVQLNSTQKFYFAKAKPSGFSTRLVTEAPEGDVNVNPDGTLAVSRDWGVIAEFDDKYDLKKVKTSKRLLSLLKQGNYNYALNDLIFFLRRLVELNDIQKLSMDTQNMSDLNAFVRKIKEKLKADSEKYPWIGSYAWCFWKLGYNQDKELWKILSDYVLEDKYYPVLKEATFAMEGFSMLNTFSGQEQIDKVYEKLERTCILTIWEVNMTYYKRIAESLVRVNRFTPHVFERIEQHVLANLTMEYELNTITDILFAFAVSGNGSKEFYNAVQFVMVKGHMFNRMAPFHMLWNDNPKHGAFVAKLIHTYSIVKEKVPELRFEPDFTALTYRLATSDRIRYNLEELVTVMEHIGVFEFEEIKEINQLLDTKLFQIEDNMYANDMIRYIDAKVRRDYGGDYTQLPEKIVTFFDNYMLKNLDAQGPGRVYYYLAESEVRGLLQGKEQLVATVIQKMGKNIQQYDFEKVCYMYWFSTRYGFMLEDKKQDLKLALDMFKDYIRLYRVMGKDKMELGTNYYKMLEVFNESDLSKKEQVIEGK